MKLPGILALCSCSLLAQAEEPTAAQQAAASLALAQATTPAEKSYAEAYCQAMHEDKPLVVFVRLPAFPISGCICCEMSDFPETEAPSVVIGLPDGKGGMNRLASCYGPSSAARIQSFLPGKPQRSATIPLSSRLPRFSPPSRGRAC